MKPSLNDKIQTIRPPFREGHLPQKSGFLLKKRHCQRPTKAGLGTSVTQIHPKNEQIDSSDKIGINLKVMATFTKVDIYCILDNSKLGSTHQQKIC